MSRIGKKAIIIPSKVNVAIDRNFVNVTGTYGELRREFLPLVNFDRQGEFLFVKTSNDSRQARAYHGLSRTLLENMILGVEKKFSRTLIAEGIGYKFFVEKNRVILHVGFTHPVSLEVPQNLNAKVESTVKIVIEGADKEKVHLFASRIRNIKPPEPYKGKGILYEGEKVRRKAGKSGK